MKNHLRWSTPGLDAFGSLQVGLSHPSWSQRGASGGGFSSKMWVWSFWGLVHIQACWFGRWFFMFQVFLVILRFHDCYFSGVYARWFVGLFCRSLREWSVNVCMRMKSCHAMDWPTWAAMCWCLWQAYKTHTSAEMHLQKAPETDSVMSDDILMPSWILKGCNHIKLLWMNRVMERFYRRTQQRWDANIANLYKQALTCELCKHKCHKAKQDKYTFYITGSQVVVFRVSSHFSAFHVWQVAKILSFPRSVLATPRFPCCSGHRISVLCLWGLVQTSGSLSTGHLCARHFLKET